ncbi:hypothetical protein JCM8097_007809 [Rhodosporidiobolus ruineniae]
MPIEIHDNFKVGTKTVVVEACDLRGDITIGSGTILQPKCTIVAAAGPIIFGQNNIVEENVVIVNRHKEPLIIGDSNLFEVGCRIESPSIGSHNTFGIKSRVSPHVAVGSHCVVGAGCVVLPSPFASSSSTTPSPAATTPTPATPTAAVPETPSAEPPEPPSSDTSMAGPSSSPPPSSPPPVSSIAPSPPSSSASDSLPDHTHVFGSENRCRKASGEGTGQAKALFVKHHEYLRDTLPKFHKLKMF